MIYDAFAHLPIYGLEDLGFVDEEKQDHLSLRVILEWVEACRLTQTEAD